MTHQPTERYKWFQTKIGSVLFRNGNGCPCAMCKDVQERGVLVADQQHASYLYDTECDYNREGTPLRYFDSRQEVEDWLADLKLAQEIKDDPEITDLLNEINNI